MISLHEKPEHTCGSVGRVKSWTPKQGKSGCCSLSQCLDAMGQDGFVLDNLKAK